MVLGRRELVPALGIDSRNIQPVVGIYTKYAILALSGPPVCSVYTATSDTKGVAFPLTSALYTDYLAKADEWNMSSEHWWNNNDRRKPKHPEQNLYQFQSITNPT
jgi:hypothetical protein